MSGALKAKVDGQWVLASSATGGGGAEEVYVGAIAPLGSEEIWYDTSVPGITPDDLRWNSAWGLVGAVSSWDVPMSGPVNTLTYVGTASFNLIAGRQYVLALTQSASYGTPTGETWGWRAERDGVFLSEHYWQITNSSQYIIPSTINIFFAVPSTGAKTMRIGVQRYNGTGTLQCRGSYTITDMGPLTGAISSAMPDTDRWNTAWGVIASDTRTTDGQFAYGIYITSLTFTAVAGRRYSMRWFAGYCGSPVGLCIIRLSAQGGAVLQDQRKNVVAGEQFTGDVTIDDWAAPAGTQTVNVIAYPPSGNLGVYGATMPARFVISDVGPVSGAVAIANPTPVWVPVTLQNGWAAEPASHQSPPRIRKIGDVVHVEGTATHPAFAVGATPFTLPEGYRPPKQLRVGFFAHRTNVGGVQYARCDVGTAGNLYITDITPAIVDPTMYFNFSFSVTP
jgi:hypothetical protein